MIVVGFDGEEITLHCVFRVAWAGVVVLRYGLWIFMFASVCILHLTRGYSKDKIFSTKLTGGMGIMAGRGSGWNGQPGPGFGSDSLRSINGWAGQMNLPQRKWLRLSEEESRRSLGDWPLAAQSTTNCVAIQTFTLVVVDVYTETKLFDFSFQHR